jgi:branched-chain amino acid transport system permease protein
LSLIAFAYLGGISTIRGAIIGGMLISQGFISYLLNNLLGISTSFQLILAGILLVVTIIANPDGLALAPPPRWVGRAKMTVREAFSRSRKGLSSTGPALGGSNE